MLEKLAQDIYKSATEKLASVPLAKKQYRRAIEMLSTGSHNFHGTTAPGMEGIMRSGVIKPGPNSKHSPVGINEVYFGTGLPAEAFMGRGYPGVALSRDYMNTLSAAVPEGTPDYLARLYSKPRNMKGLAWQAGLHSSPARGEAVDWTAFPGIVPLPQKGYAITSDRVNVSDDLRRLRMRNIPASIMDSAMQRLKDIRGFPKYEY